MLQPGLYPVNPNEQHVDIVGVGFAEKSVKTNLKSLDGVPVLDESGEPEVVDDESGISFPSNDGFRIHMDFTAVWGIMPDQAADVIRKFGTLDAVEAKVVIPQIESICRNQGSSLGAVDLLVGDTRRKFQEEVSDSFEKVLEDKGLTLLHGFVRNIHIPLDVREPIQQKFVADELKLTRDQELLTAGTEATLREAEKKVELETERIKAETKKLVAQAEAEGEKEAEETKAETLKLSAVIARKTAELEAEASVTLGKAKAGCEATGSGSKIRTLHTGRVCIRIRFSLQPMDVRHRIARRHPARNSLRWRRHVLDRPERLHRRHDRTPDDGTAESHEGEIVTSVTPLAHSDESKRGRNQ